MGIDGAITGPAVSTTPTLNDPDRVFPLSSWVVQCTTVVPIGNTSPESASHVTFTGPSTASSALTENATVAPSGAVASTLAMLPGRESTGGVVSGGGGG